MLALISGQAGLAVILGPQPQLRPVKGEPSTINEYDAARALDGFSDVEEVAVTGVLQADQLARAAYYKARGLRVPRGAGVKVGVVRVELIEAAARKGKVTTTRNRKKSSQSTAEEQVFQPGIYVY